MRRFLILWLAGLIFAPHTMAQGNLLADPSFEGEQYVLLSTDPLDGTTFSVPVGWSGGVIREPHSERWMNVQPTGFPHTGHVVWSGRRSLHVARGGGTFTAFVLQQVSVAQGTEVQGGARAFIESAPGAAVRVGIDPEGGTNPFSPSVVWSNWGGAIYDWNYMSVNAKVDSGVATLFLYATQSQPSDPNGVYWDEAFLNGVAGVGLPQQGQPQPAGGRYVTSSLRVNVRDGAGLNFNRIGLIEVGDAYTLISEADGWYVIDFNGRTGYVSSQFVSVAEGQPPQGGGVPTVESLDFDVNYTLRLRASPSADSPELAIVPFESVVRAIGRTGDSAWIQIVYEGQTGWVMARYGRLNGNIRSLPVR